MKIAKLPDGQLVEILKIADVQFDPRPDWILTSKPVGARPRHMELKWHPPGTRFEWVREFHFKENDNA